MAHDVFISYSSKDKTIADAVCARLEARGIRCWIAPRDVQPGQPYGEEIIDAIHASKAMVLVFSANANASPHIPKEIERAVSHGVPVIPLRVEAVTPGKSLDYFISSVHWLDAITPPLENHLESLANTIRTMLPEASRTAVEQVALPALPENLHAAQPKKRSNFVVAIAISIAVVFVVVAGIGGYFLARPTDNAVNESPAPGSSALPSTKNAAAGAISSSGRDPVIGCWQWFNNVPVTISPNGQLVAGPFTARWQRVGQRAYHFTWPEAVDAVTISGDGNSLNGGNQYGFPMSAVRVAPGMGLAGAWRWANGAIVLIRPDGNFSVGPFSGRWKATSQNTFNLTWPNPVDSVNLSSDGRRISGHNQYGIAISGTRMSSCGI